MRAKAAPPHPGVCITGMHRSGTSMVARLLAEAGLGLGPPERLMPPQADNPDGFYENLDLVRLGDALLDRLGGAWDAPPPILDAARVDAGVLDTLASKADLLLDTVAGAGASGAAWGWKDPRATLALAFWRRRRPELRVVACLRHPLAVARSLQQRHKVSLRFGLRLWQAYNEALLAQARGGPVLLTHYDAWLLDPAAELRRVAAFAGLPLDAAVEDAVAQHVRAAPPAPLASADAALATIGLAGTQLYATLCGQAGPVFARTQAAATLPPPQSPSPQRTHAAVPDDELLLLRERVAALDAELQAVRRAAPYRVGATVDARLGGNAPLYLGTGWTAARDAGTWSIGERSEIHLRLHALPPGHAAAVRARVRPMVGPGHESMTLTLHAGDTKVASWTLQRAQATSLSCTIDAALLGNEQPVRLVFGVDQPCAPSAIGISADTRPLGILLISLQVQAGEPA